MKSTVAVFDFDGTLTYRDTLLPFLRYIRGGATTAYSIALAIPELVVCPFDESYRQKAKETVLRHTLKGIHNQELSKKAQLFAADIISRKLRPDGMQKLRWHQEQSHRCILVSATLDVYLDPWAKHMGFQDLICSELEIDPQGLYTGNLVGLNCWGPEKSRRLLQMLGLKENFILYAYGDSRGDKELLSLADYPFYKRFS